MPQREVHPQTLAPLIGANPDDKALPDSVHTSLAPMASNDGEQNADVAVRETPNDVTSAPTLTDAPSPFAPCELTALEGLETKYHDIRTNALLVAKGHFTGFYAYGPGGVGKSHQIRQALESADQPPILFNTHVTGAAFFRQMATSPAGLFLIEDLETLFNDRLARNALRAALWGERNAQGRMVRHVTYTTMRDKFDFDFQGGIIFTMNRPLKDVPEIAALATRILVTNFNPTRAELLAVAKQIALGGYRTDKGALSVDLALEVYQYYKTQLDRFPDRLPDLRLLFKGFEYRLAIGISALPNNPLTWQESFLAQLEHSQEAVVHDRKAKLESEEKLALHLHAQMERGVFDGKVMLARFKAATGASSQQTFYSRLERAKKRMGIQPTTAPHSDAPANGTQSPP